MFDNVLHVMESLHSITESFHAFLLRLHGPSHDDFLKLGGLFAWAETLTVIAAAYMKRMIPLRALAMLANVFGFAVSLCTGSFAGFSKHAVNFPLNATRLREMRRLIASVREAGATDLNVEWLRPFMHPRAFKAGQPVFSKGDAASEAFVLVEGRIIVPERSAVLEPGAIFGEMALFTADSRRTASAVCASDVMNSSSSCIIKIRNSASISFGSSYDAMR